MDRSTKGTSDMDTAFSTRVAVDMKDSGEMIDLKDKVNLCIMTEMFTMVNGKMINCMGMESILQQMNSIYMKEHGQRI